MIYFLGYNKTRRPQQNNRIRNRSPSNFREVSDQLNDQVEVGHSDPNNSGT